MADMMTFPETVEEYMEQNKIVDRKHVYTNGAELVPIFRMKQWFEHKPERKVGKWIFDGDCYKCNKCGAVYGWWADSQTSNYCPNCGAKMGVEQQEPEG